MQYYPKNVNPPPRNLAKTWQKPHEPSPRIFKP
jgi:hypothetical protein